MYDPATISAFVCMFVLALIVKIVGYYFYRKEKKDFLAQKKVPICKDAFCKELEPLMVLLMKQKLDFQDQKKELNAVKNHLKCKYLFCYFICSKSERLELFSAMFNNVHGNIEHSMYQCLRSTLVMYPDDIRGRRRANEARKILEYDVWGRTDIPHRIEILWDAFYENFLTCGQWWMKKFYSELFAIFSVIKVLIVSGLDLYSDILVLFGIYYAHHLTENGKDGFQVYQFSPF